MLLAKIHMRLTCCSKNYTAQFVHSCKCGSTLGVLEPSADVVLATASRQGRSLVQLLCLLGAVYTRPLAVLKVWGL